MVERGLRESSAAPGEYVGGISSNVVWLALLDLTLIGMTWHHFPRV